MEKRVIKSLIIEKQNEIPSMDSCQGNWSWKKHATMFSWDCAAQVNHI